MELHRLRYAEARAPQASHLSMLRFLDGELRAGAGFSVSAEYPSLFGEYPGGESLYLECEGRIASHVGLLVREFAHQSIRFKVGLLGSVVTAPAFRGRGLATRLVREACDTLKRHGAAVCLLWSDRADFYAPMGFHRAGREWDLRFSALHLPPVDGEALDFNPARHVSMLWHLYTRHDVKVDRSLEEHRRLFAIPKVRAFVTERNGIATSYLVINKGADFENYIHEWGGEPDEVRRNVAWVQKHRFPHQELTLIAPAHYRLEPLKQIATALAEGVLGWMKVIDRSQLLLLYGEYLKSRSSSYRWSRERQTLAIEGKEHSVALDQEILRLVFGEGEATAAGHPCLPFFLWGFDSI